MKQFSVNIEPEYDDPSGDPDLANDFPIYKEGIEWLEITIKNEREECLRLSFSLDKKEGVMIGFYIFEEDIYLRFRGGKTIYKSVLKLIYRFPESIRHKHRQYRLLKLIEELK